MTKRRNSRVSSASHKTNVVISGRGLSFSVLDIDSDTFKEFTTTGISRDEFVSLRAQLDDDNYWITAPFLNETTVTIDGTMFCGSWENIKAQCRVLPPPTKVYEVPAGSYSVIFELIHKGEFANDQVANFDPMKLRFDVDYVELAAGNRYVLLDPYYKGKSLAWGRTATNGDIYVVDRQGRRYDIKVN